MANLKSESSKTDKEIVWEKLSTPPPSPVKSWWHDIPPGELTIFMAKSNCGKTMFDIEAHK